MSRNLFTPVSVRRRSAAQGCANALRRSPTADAPQGGWVRRVDIGFWQDTEAERSYKPLTRSGPTFSPPAGSERVGRSDRPGSEPGSRRVPGSVGRGR